MGLINMRARCPNCGGLIHTAPKGIGNLALWLRNGPLMVKTGKQCQWCGVALTGSVNWANTAILAPQPSPKTAVIKKTKVLSQKAARRQRRPHGKRLTRSRRLKLPICLESLGNR